MHLNEASKQDCDNPYVTSITIHVAQINYCWIGSFLRNEAYQITVRNALDKAAKTAGEKYHVIRNLDYRTQWEGMEFHGSSLEAVISAANEVAKLLSNFDGVQPLPLYVPLLSLSPHANACEGQALQLLKPVLPTRSVVQNDGSYADGEVLGIDKDGALIKWDASNGVPYNSGETVEQYGITNMFADELARVKRDEQSSKIMWTRETAIAYLETLELPFAAMKMTAKIVGSVASNGNSEKDLDVVLKPLPGVTMTTECGLGAIFEHLAPLMVEGEKSEPFETDLPEPSWFVNFGTRDGRTVEFYLPERDFPNVHPHEIALAKS